MSSVNYENQILDAVETIVDKAVANAGYDRTIKATIISLEDAEKGKYKIQYQDSIIEAYSNNTNIIYPDGTLVYILIPGSDFSQNKQIIDAVDKNAIEYQNVTEEDDQYEIVGQNSISSDQIFSLCSYHGAQKQYVYDKDLGINDINFDQIIFTESIENNETMLCGAYFKNTFDITQKRQGNFGVGFILEFKDNITGNIIEKEYVVDVNKMVGTPYDLNAFTRQDGIFKINSENFTNVKQIYIFCENFPNEVESTYIASNDIFVCDFELYGLRTLTEDEKQGYNVVLTKSGKGYYDDTNLSIDTIDIVATFKRGTEEIENNNINYYWFKEDRTITINSDTYVNYAGYGWSCLNDYNQDDDGLRSWLTKNNTITVTKADCNIAFTNFKCIVVIDDKVLAEKTVSITNYAAIHNIDITSDIGTYFYFDNGRPTLTCCVDGNAAPGDYEYYWSMVDVNNVTTNLEETTESNYTYNITKSDYDILKAKIAAEEIMPAATQAELDELEAILNNFENIQRVEKNKIFNIDMRHITDQTAFKCMVKNGDLILGTATLVLTNVLQTEGDYTLTIVNGTQVFTYDDFGISPASHSLENPINIQPLSFTIKNNLGLLLDNVTLNECEVQWIVPKENTMLIAEDSNNLVLTYAISNEYDINKNNNNIQLIVKYKDMTLEAHTLFTFVKQGEPGTNGTDIICKIVPNTTDSNFDDYPMILNGALNYPRPSGQTNKWFKIQLWNSSEKIWEGIDSDSTHIVEWKVLGNTYTDSTKDSSAIGVNGSNFSYSGYNINYPVNIIRGSVKYNNINYYCTMPIITASVSNGYGIKLLKNTGFRYVCYSSDGRNPQFANAKPFEIQVTQQINDYVEDISTVSNNYTLTYTWTVYGRYYNGTSWVTDKHLDAVDNATGNIKAYTPSKDYDGENVTNAIRVVVKQNGTTKAEIFIPIHFYLNRYGLGLLSNWDGNSITLDNEKGRILTPQVGAGELDSNSQFTGVYMGSVREAGRQTKDVGLIAYSKGQRSIFLNSKNGSAIFGKNSNGQIIIDPQSNKALLYSNSFWKTYNLEGNNYGLPSNYNASNESGAGMIIDLAKPEIRYGNGKFKVNSNGELTAQGGGYIGGWTIGKDGTDDVLYNNQLFLNGTKGQIYSTKKGLETNSDGFYLAKEGIALGKTTTYELADGTNVIKSKFQVDNQGNLYASNVVLKGRVSATSGYIGSGSNVWTIKNNYIYNGKTAINDNAEGVYIGTNGIALGANSVFAVTKVGALTAKSGDIAGWTVNANSFTKDKVGISSNRTNDNSIAFWAGNTNANDALFKVTFGGALTATSANIQGAIAATSGTFGNGTNKITIGTNGTNNINSAIYSGSKSTFATNATGFYLGTNGLAIGAVADGTSAFQVGTNGALVAKSATISGTLTAGANSTIGPWLVTATDIHNTKTGIGNNNENGVYIGTDGIGLGQRNNYGTSSSTDYHAKFEVTNTGALYASNANIDGKITADEGKIGGWSITSGKIYAGDSSTGVAVMQCPSSGTTNVFAAGGTSHSDYSNCKFRVTKAGAMYAESGKIGNWNISSGAIKYNDNIYLGSGGSVRFGTSSYYFSMGNESNHPSVSGLNVKSAGITMNNHGISKCNDISNSAGSLNISSSGSMTLDVDSGSAIIVKSAGGNSIHLRSDTYGDVTHGSVKYLRWGTLLTQVYGGSSKNIKQNINLLTKEQKEQLYSLYKNIPLYSYDYKQEYIDGQKNNYGFMIEDIENTILKDLLHIKYNKEDKNLKYYSTYDLAKMNLIVIQILQNKIQLLEKQLKEIKGE